MTLYQLAQTVLKVDLGMCIITSSLSVFDYSATGFNRLRPELNDTHKDHLQRLFQIHIP